MIVSHRHKYIYLALPKTGSIGMRNILIEHFAGERYKPHHLVVIPKGCEDYLVFTTVRNPYARFMSLFNFVRRMPKHRLYPVATTEIEFARWLADKTIEPSIEFTQDEVDYFYPEFRPELMKGREPNQTEFLSMSRQATILHLEQLNHEFFQLPFVEEPDFDVMPVINADPNGPNGVPVEMLKANPELEEAIYQWSGPDFINFGYTRFVA